MPATAIECPSCNELRDRLTIEGICLECVLADCKRKPAVEEPCEPDFIVET